jgi:hypothetical protein
MLLNMGGAQRDEKVTQSVCFPGVKASTLAELSEGCP